MGLKTVPLKSKAANKGCAQALRMREEGLFMSFPVSTFKALVSGVGRLCAEAFARAAQIAFHQLDE